MPGTDVRQDTDIRPDLSFGDGDHERFAHYVQKDKIVDSAVTGTPVDGAVRQGLGAEPGSEEVPGLPGLQADLRVAARGRRDD